MVAQGYSQTPGLDYDDTFSPVVRFESISTVLALAVERNWKVHQMDVTTAFLNGKLHDTVNMKQPEGYIKSGQEQKVCRLRSLYGLKQSPRCWNSVLDTHLKSMGFTQLKSDPYIYVSTSEGVSTLVLAVYVDDILKLKKPLKN